MHNEFHNLYSSSNIISKQIKKNEMGGICSMHGRYEKLK
jgi:hypothetical protein